MNSYSINLIPYDGVEPGIYDSELSGIRKAIGYFVLFGQNLRFTPIQSPYTENSPSIISADFDFSLSNIKGLWGFVNSNNSVIGTQTVYDTNCQGVKEYVDKPYAVKGLLAISTPSGSDFDPTKDMDNFISFTYLSAEDGRQRTIFVGKCNSSKTDFYTPFEGIPTSFIDIDAISKRV